MDIREIESTVKKTFGDNGMIFLVGGFIIVFAIVYFTQSKQQETETVKITGAYNSYPDTVTNADTITDTMQESVNYQTEELKEYLDSKLNGYDSQEFDKVVSNNSVYGDSTEISEGLDTLTKAVNNLTTAQNNTNKAVTNKLQEVIDTNKSVVGTNNGSVKQGGSTEYFSKTPYTGVSIVDGLKAIGEYNLSSYSGRSQIAKANGIKNYTGTANQNLELLNRLKKGTLIRP